MSESEARWKLVEAICDYAINTQSGAGDFGHVGAVINDLMTAVRESEQRDLLARLEHANATITQMEATERRIRIASGYDQGQRDLLARVREMVEAHASDALGKADAAKAAGDGSTYAYFDGKEDACVVIMLALYTLLDPPPSDPPASKE